MLPAWTMAALAADGQLGERASGIEDIASAIGVDASGMAEQAVGLRISRHRWAPYGRAACALRTRRTHGAYGLGCYRAVALSPGRGGSGRPGAGAGDH